MKDILAYLTERTPKARLERHKAFFAGTTDPKVTALLEAADRLIVDGKACNKALSILKDLDHYRTIQEWNTDPDTIAGESLPAARLKGGKNAGEKRKREKADNADIAADLWDQHASLPEHNRAALIARKMGISASTVRRYLAMTGKKATKTRSR